MKENIKDVYEYSYDICQECKDYGESVRNKLLIFSTVIVVIVPIKGVPYDCSSIMHYGTETFSVGGEEQPTMRRKHPDCDLRLVDKDDAIDEFCWKTIMDKS